MSEAIVPGSRATLWRLALFALVSALLFALLYYPHPPDSRAADLLSGYVAWVARAATHVIALFDPSVVLMDHVVIAGRFPLRIVLDCTALDVQALFVSAVLAAPASARSKLLGALGGVAFLAVANLVRIVALYYVGVHAPARFDLMHEDVFTFAMLACACLAFFLFATQHSRARAAIDHPSTARE
ncbi:MAG TPA: hypothetical protein VI299_20965 [Polyangiales bacterium]